MAECISLVFNRIDLSEEEKMANVFIQAAKDFFYHIPGKIYAVPSIRKGRDMDLIVWMHFNNYKPSIKTGYISNPNQMGEKVYSIIPEGENVTLFEKFVDENKVVYKDEIKDILKRLKQIGHATGARESFFKHEGDNEFFRKYGKYVWALYDDDERKLRLYCIRFTNVAIILGGGGYKDKSVIKWQDDENLSEEVRKIMAYAEIILKQLDDGDLYWSNNGAELEGNLKNYDNE